MGPDALIQRCMKLGIDWIAITDHNSMANCPAYEKVAKRYGLAYTWGVELQSSEEIHLLAYFDDREAAKDFDKELFASLLPIANDADFFGDQVVVDENENIINVVERALINSSIWSIDEAVEAVRRYNGYCIPAHIDASANSIISQLGFIANPDAYDAFGITATLDADKFVASNPAIPAKKLIRCSDAHYLSDLGSGYTRVYVKSPTMQELIFATMGYENREILI